MRKMTRDERREDQGNQPGETEGGPGSLHGVQGRTCRWHVR